MTEHPDGEGQRKTYQHDHPRGWLVVLGAGCIQCAVFGLIQSFPVFHHLMSKDASLGFPTKAQLSLVNAVCSSVGIWVGWIWGYFGAQFGPRILLVIATVLIAMSTVLPPLLAHSYISMILLYSVPLTMASGIVNAPISATVGAWFQKYISVSMGVMQGGASVGSLAGPVAIVYVADATGNWRTSYFVLSSFLLLGVASVLLVKPRVPTEESRPDLDETILESKGRFIALVVQIWRDLKCAAKICFSPNFGFLFVSGVAVGYNFFSVIYVVILIALDFGVDGTPYSHLKKMSLTAASSVFVPFGITQAVGSVAWGLVGLKLPTRYAAALSLATSGLSSIFLAEAETLTMLLVGMTLSGFATSGGWVLFPALIVEYFPNAGSLLGLVMGLGYTSIGIGGTLGPLFTTLITVNPDLGGGSYTLGLAVCAGLCVVGAAACAYCLPEPPEQAQGMEESVGQGGDEKRDQSPSPNASEEKTTTGGDEAQRLLMPSEQ